MERVIYLGKRFRNLAIFCFLEFVLAEVFSLYVSFTKVPKDRAVYAAMLFGTFFGLLACGGAWMLLTYLRGWLHIKDGRICQHGVVAKKDIDLALVTTAHWKVQSRVTLRTSIERLTIDFNNFEPTNALWLVRLFHGRLSESIQIDWPMFASKVAVRLRDRNASNNRPPGPGEILITRGRWDWYFIPAILLSGAIGIVLSSTLQRREVLLAPLGPTVLWLVMRFATPRHGMRAPRISTELNRGFLYFILAWGCLGIVGSWAFNFLNPPQPLAVWLAVVCCTFWFGSLLFAAQWFDRGRRRRDLETAKLAVQRWDEGERSAGESASNIGSAEAT